MEKYRLSAEVVKYEDMPSLRVKIVGRDSFVVIRLDGEGCEDEFCVMEDLTPEMAEYVVGRINAN